MKSIRSVMVVFLVVGALMLVGAVLFTVNTNRFLARAQTAPGVVIEMLETRDSDNDLMYKPVVRFTARDRGEFTFTSSTSSRPPAYDVGESVEVLYSPDDPHDARIRGFASLWLGPVVLGILGLVFTGLGVGFILHRRAGAAQRQYLRAHGTRIETQFQSVVLNTSLEVNGRNPWRIVSQWHNPATGNVRVFESENLWFDPSEYVKPGSVFVLIDPHDERRYHMDVSFLPKLENA